MENTTVDYMAETHNRSLATLRTIDTISPIEGSDFLEVVTMKDLGWKVVVKKGELKVGEQVVYFEIDSAIRLKNLLPCMEFLKDRCTRKFTNGKNTVFEEVIRIKTLKLRGVISQGLIIPLETILKEMPIEWTNGCCLTFDDGSDWTQYLKVEHFDILKEHYDELCGHIKAPDCKGNFPSWIPKTDEPRLENLMDYFEKFNDTAFEVTEKFDGSSMTFFYGPKFRPEEPVGLCSRAQEKKFDAGSQWWTPIIQAKLVDKVADYFKDRNIALQGELVGPGLNANRDHYSEVHWKIFRIWDGDKQCFVTPDERYKICEDLGLEHVKVITVDKVFQKYHNIDEFRAYVASGKTDHGYEREGFVFKSVEDGNLSFKVINPNYLLKYE